MALIRNILLDRDGTIIHDRHYLSDPDGVELFEGAGAALAALSKEGRGLFMVSNQSGINRGYFSAADAEACNARMSELLQGFGAVMTGMVYCPHAPEDGCACRKPGVGMWEELKNRHGLSAEETIMVGDKSEDMAFAANSDIKARILVLTGKGGDVAEKLALAEYPGELCGKVTFVEAKDKKYPQLVIPDLSYLPEAVRLVEKKF